MFKAVDFYYFSPTGGTKRAGEIFCRAIAGKANEMNLASGGMAGETDGALGVLAAPVYGGRIPALAIDRIRELNGKGKKAVLLAVYGNRDYDDALLELKDAACACGFIPVAAAALIAQHSIVPEVGAGRPDAQDEAYIAAFARKVLEKLDSGAETVVEVPGNHPYREGMNLPVSPVSLENCDGCGKCAALCPAEAIRLADGRPETDVQKCMLCMACAAHCPRKARILPPSLQASMNEKLGALKNVRKENICFL